MSYTPPVKPAAEYRHAIDLLRQAIPIPTPATEWALQRLYRNTTWRAANKALPMTPAMEALVWSLRAQDPPMRLQDIVEATGCAYHDVSVLVNGSRP